MHKGSITAKARATVNIARFRCFLFTKYCLPVGTCCNGKLSFLFTILNYEQSLDNTQQQSNSQNEENLRGEEETNGVRSVGDDQLGAGW
jgi:hypothetical protein